MLHANPATLSTQERHQLASRTPRACHTPTSRAPLLRDVCHALRWLRAPLVVHTSRTTHVCCRSGGGSSMQRCDRHVTHTAHCDAPISLSHAKSVTCPTFRPKQNAPDPGPRALTPLASSSLAHLHREPVLASFSQLSGCLSLSVKISSFTLSPFLEKLA